MISYRELPLHFVLEERFISISVVNYSTVSENELTGFIIKNPSKYKIYLL